MKVFRPRNVASDRQCVSEERERREEASKVLPAAVESRFWRLNKLQGSVAHFSAVESTIYIQCMS